LPSSAFFFTCFERTAFRLMSPAPICAAAYALPVPRMLSTAIVESTFAYVSLLAAFSHISTLPLRPLRPAG
jgi:hypothetical protein